MRPLLLALFAVAIFASAMATRDASLSVRIRDASGKPTAVRARLLDSAGKPAKNVGAPAAAVAVMYGRSDAAEGFEAQPDGAFYVEGAFALTLPPGKYSLALSKGSEYLQQTVEIDLQPGRKVSRDLRMVRWIDQPARGWYSADDHIHLRRSRRENPLILRWMEAEDIHVGNILQMGDFWTHVYAQYAFGKAGRYQEGDYVLSPGQEEPRTPEIGHTISLGAEQFVRLQSDYYSYDRVFDRVRQLGGVAGFAHQGFSFHGERGLALNVVRGKVDFLELLQFCVPEGPLALGNYYRFLDLGYRLTALAGSDFPWCGRGRFGIEGAPTQIGDARFYTLVEGGFSFEKWMEAVKAGRTFVSSGPMLELTVNGQPPGSTVEVARGARLRIVARALGHPGQVPLKELELVAHGETVRKVGPGDGKSLAIEMELPVERGLWIAAKAAGGPTQFAHTTPVYVTVGGGGFANPKTFARRLEECEAALADLERHLAGTPKRLDEQAQRHRGALERQIAEARRVLAQRKAAGE